MYQAKRAPALLDVLPCVRSRHGKGASTPTAGAPAVAGACAAGEAAPTPKSGLRARGKVTRYGRGHGTRHALRASTRPGKGGIRRGFPPSPPASDG